MYTNPKKKKLQKKIFFIALSVALVSGSIYYAVNRNSSKHKTSDSNGQTIDYSPATTEEKKGNDSNKERITTDNNTQNTPAEAPNSNTQKKSVTPIITNTSSSINAYIPGIFEDGGVCTASFTKAGATKTKTSVGFQNVSYTQCSPIMLENNFLSPGQWAVTVSYNSTSASGTSASQTIEVN